MIKKILKLIILIQNHGLKESIKILKKKVFISPIPFISQRRTAFEDKIGLELGGPSDIFKANNLLPIYHIAKVIDGVNFSNSTVWEGELNEGLNYNYYKNKNGYQFITDATQLQNIESEKYDFILSSHNLEHIANPLKAIKEWLRVLKPNGYLLLVLPNKNFTFDHKRPITNFENILSDFENNIEENDLSHIDEILALHDLNKDPGISIYQEFKNRSYKNFENRCLHHHVFDENLLKEIFLYLNITTLAYEEAEPFNLIIFGQKN